MQCLLQGLERKLKNSSEIKSKISYYYNDIIEGKKWLLSIERFRMLLF